MSETVTINERFDLGPCCACEASGETVRNIMMLPWRALEPGVGGGWGCVVCDLPPEGAYAVLCDACVDEERYPVYAIVGDVAGHRRCSLSALTEPFAHCPEYHEEER